MRLSGRRRAGRRSSRDRRSRRDHRARAGTGANDVGERRDDPAAFDQLLQLPPREAITAFHFRTPSSNRRTAVASSLRAFPNLA